MPAEPPTPRPAATVILLRRGGRHSASGLEVLMLRRGAAASFMPGVWVFAGGIVEPADLEAARGADHASFERTRAPLDEEEVAHRIAGARELGEEAGVALDPRLLLPWSRWITPRPVPTRFDTRFYVARAPAHCAPEPDGIEMDEARWIAPAEALQAGERDELELTFPTIRHLEGLAVHADADEVIAEARMRAIEAITPRVAGSREEFTVLLPGEPGYEDAV